MKRLLLTAAVAVLWTGEAAAQKEPDVLAVNARAHAEALKLAWFGLEDLIRRRSTEAVSWSGDRPPGTVGGVGSGWLPDWTERGLRARYCTDDPAVPGTLLVWLHPARAMGVGGDHRSVHAAPRLYGRERRALHWLNAGVAEGGDGRSGVTLPACMTTGLPSGRAALAGAVEDPWVATVERVEWKTRDAACPAGTYRPADLAASEPARVERARLTRTFNKKGVEVGAPPPDSALTWLDSVNHCVRGTQVTETETRPCSYDVEGRSVQGYDIWRRRTWVPAAAGTASPWTQVGSTCPTGAVASIPPPSGTPETLPPPVIRMVMSMKPNPPREIGCATCMDGMKYQQRRHTDRHAQFEWDSAPIVQIDYVAPSNWITVRDTCTPTPPTVVGRGTRTVSVPCSCASGWSGTCSQSQTETYREEIPCGGSLRTVVESVGAVVVTSNTCVSSGGNSADSGGGGGGYITDPTTGIGHGWGELAGQTDQHADGTPSNGVSGGQSGSDTSDESDWGGEGLGWS